MFSSRLLRIAMIYWQVYDVVQFAREQARSNTRVVGLWSIAPKIAKETWSSTHHAQAHTR